MDDAKIVELYLARSETAISETSRKYGTRLQRIALNIVGDIPAAEECENDTYFKAWNTIPPNEPRDYFFAFLARIVRGFAIDACRRNAAQKRSAAFCELTHELEQCLPSGVSVESEAEANELGLLIRAFVMTLPEPDRMLFVRRYWYGDPTSALAERFGVSRSGITTKLWRIRGLLKEHLEREGYGI